MLPQKTHLNYLEEPKVNGMRFEWLIVMLLLTQRGISSGRNMKRALSFHKTKFSNLLVLQTMSQNLRNKYGLLCMTQTITHFDDIVRTSKIPYDLSRTRYQNNMRKQTRTVKTINEVIHRKEIKKTQNKSLFKPTLNCPQVFSAEVHQSKTPPPVEVHLF